MIGIGLIGCGGISQRHVQWFLDRGECEIRGLCDIVPERAEERRELVGKRQTSPVPDVLTDYRDMLNREDIDVVAVLLPHNLHHPVSVDALHAGKHVLVEKPMVITVEEAESLADAVSTTGLLLGIGYQRSYIPEYLYVEKMIRSGEFGPIRFVNAHVEQTWLRHALAQKGEGTWRADPAQAGGGQLMDTGSHTVAAMLQVTGLRPEEVFAWTDKAGLDVEVDTAMVVRFAGSVLGSISVGGFGHAVTECLRIVGDNHSARIFFRTVKEQALEIDGKVVDAKSAVPASTPNANIIDAIQGKAEIGADVDLGLRVAQLTQATYRSAESGVPVRV